MAAITQIRHKHSDGRTYYERKIAEGKTHKEALRCLKRRISDAIYARLRAGARAAGPGGQPGNHSVSRAAGSHPAHRLFGQVLISPRGTPRRRENRGGLPADADVSLGREPADQVWRGGLDLDGSRIVATSTPVSFPAS
jgi:hypothetical protein